MKEAIKVENAGMVILTNYIPVLLERLRLVSGKQFTSSENQHNAALYLQYLITGLQKTDEVYLSLNKVLCGLPVNQDLADQMEISNEDQLLMTGLKKLLFHTGQPLAAVLLMLSEIIGLSGMEY